MSRQKSQRRWICCHTRRRCNVFVMKEKTVRLDARLDRCHYGFGGNAKVSVEFAGGG
jgi:hypothetical protein